MAKLPHILLMLNFNSAQLPQVRVHDLGIKQQVTSLFEMEYQFVERYLRGIRAAGKHRLSKKCASDRYAIQAADKLTLLPAFNAVGKTKAVQLAIGLHNFIGNPGFMIIFSRRGAPLDYT